MRLLVTGACGTVGRAVVAVAEAAGHEVHGTCRHRGVDLAAPDEVRRAIVDARPALVVHAGAWTAVDAAERDPEGAWTTNAGGTAAVVDAAAAIDAHVVYLSTDHVFDGTGDRPHREDDERRPRSAYGRAKAGGEDALRPDDTVVRTSWVWGRTGPSTIATIREQAAGDGPLRFVDDQRGRPTFAEDLAPAILDLGLARAPGPWHVANSGAATWFEVARTVLEVLGEDPDRVEPIATAALDPPLAAPRPANAVLGDDRWRASGRHPLPHHRDALLRSLRPVFD